MIKAYKLSEPCLLAAHASVCMSCKIDANLNQGISPVSATVSVDIIADTSIIARLIDVCPYVLTRHAVLIRVREFCQFLPFAKTAVCVMRVIKAFNLGSIFVLKSTIVIV